MTKEKIGSAEGVEFWYEDDAVRLYHGNEKSFIFWPDSFKKVCKDYLKLYERKEREMIDRGRERILKSIIDGTLNPDRDMTLNELFREIDFDKECYGNYAISFHSVMNRPIAVVSHLTFDGEVRYVLLENAADENWYIMQ